MEESMTQYKSVKYDLPASQSSLSSHHQKLVNEAVTEFDKKTHNFKEENLYKEYLQNLKVIIKDFASILSASKLFFKGSLASTV